MSKQPLVVTTIPVRTDPRLLHLDRQFFTIRRLIASQDIFSSQSTRLVVLKSLLIHNRSVSTFLSFQFALQDELFILSRRSTEPHVGNGDTAFDKAVS
ncbi:hypothetical protein P154DRAFT_521431, partial [Amniculicola lignicola CBS 123094]